MSAALTVSLTALRNVLVTKTIEIQRSDFHSTYKGWKDLQTLAATDHGYPYDVSQDWRVTQAEDATFAS